MYTSVIRAVEELSKTVGISIGGGSACSRGDCGGRVGDLLASGGSRGALPGPKWVPTMLFFGPTRNDWCKKYRFSVQIGTKIHQIGYTSSETVCQQFCKLSIRPVNHENVRSRSATKAKRFGVDPTFLKSIRFRRATRPIDPGVMKWEPPTLLSRTTDVAGRFLFGVGGSGRRPLEIRRPRGEAACGVTSNHVVCSSGSR